MCLALLAEDPARPHVPSRAAALAHQAAPLAWRPATKTAGDATGGPFSSTAGTATGRYDRRAVLLGEPLLGRPGVAVLVERRARALPSPGRLAEASGLTPRESEVALLPAERRRNREVAAALSVSEKTASRRTGAVLAKLGARSRDDVARAVHAAAQ